MQYDGVAISMVYPIAKTLVRLGFDPDDFFRRVSFDAALLRDVDARIPGEELERLTVAAAEYAGDALFGLRQGAMMEFADMGVLGYVMLHSATIADALEAYRRYNDILCSGANLELEYRDGLVVIRLFPRSASVRLSRHCVEDMVCSLYLLMGKLGNRPIPLKEIRFAHAAPSGTEPYEKAFGLIPRFGEEFDALVLDEEALRNPVLYSDPRLLETFETMAKETKRSLTRTGEFSERVVEWIERCLPSYFPTLRQTADSFGSSPRTIQNRLKEENTTYADLTAKVRKELAIGYLRKNEISVGEIAYALHFSEPSAFLNAFKKWTGQTPGQFRARARAERMAR